MRRDINGTAIMIFLGILVIAVNVVLHLNQTITASTNAKVALPTVIIDAGHGGFDGGAQGSDGTLEKDLNLAVSLQLEKKLKALGFPTVMVRTEDTAVNTVDGSIREKKRSDLLYRHSLMDQYPDALYLCIHQNHFGQTSVKGAQVFYSVNDEQSETLAQLVQNAIRDTVQTDNTRVIKPITDDVYVVYHATVPSVLIECGFLSNPDDLANLKNQDYQIKLADAIATAVGAFVSEQGG